MKLALPCNRPLGDGLVALAAGLTREAAEQLAAVATEPVASVHRARVALKRARSTLRLLERTGADWAGGPRQRLTELARRMSAARENAVAAALAEKLSRRLRGRERAVAELLAGRPGRLVPPFAARIREALLLEAQLLTTAPAPAISPAQLRAMLRQNLDRTSRRHYTAATDPTLESVHEWRKAVIVLRDQAALAAARWPAGAGTAHPLLFRLARQLGRQGDRALLVRRLRALRVPPLLALARRRLIVRLEERRRLATLAAMLRWLRLEAQLTRLLMEQKEERGVPTRRRRSGATAPVI